MPTQDRVSAVFNAMMSAERHVFSSQVGVPPELVVTDPDADGRVQWAPLRAAIPVSVLDSLYALVPGPLPALFEECLLSFRWVRVELGVVELFGSTSDNLAAFASEVMRDGHLFPPLFRERYVEIGKAAGGSYDPVCFDLRRSRNRDCPMVRIDHESVLVGGSPEVLSDVAPSFGAFVKSLAT